MKADYEQIDQLITREQILAAKGVELSLLISKYVMHDSTIINIAGKNFEIPSEDYAIDISAAWEVVEALKRKGVYMAFAMHRDTYNFSVWDSEGVELIIDWVRCETAPEAICKAALLAVLEAANG